MKLISMSEFVIKQMEKKEQKSSFSMANCYDYALFLSQPLRIEMFTTEPIFSNIKIDSYNKVFCAGYVGEVIKGKLHSPYRTVQDLINVNNGILIKETDFWQFYQHLA